MAKGRVRAIHSTVAKPGTFLVDAPGYDALNRGSTPQRSRLALAGLALAPFKNQPLWPFSSLLSVTSQQRGNRHHCVASARTYVPDSEENKRRCEQQSQHVAKGRESERHFSSVLLGRIRARSVGRRMMQAVSRPVSRFVAFSSSSVA